MEHKKPLLLKLDELEATAIDFVVKIVVWLTPLFTGILIFEALDTSVELGVFGSAVGAFVIEAAGVGFMHTAMGYFYGWRGEQSNKVNFFITLSCVIGYVITAFVIALVIKLPDDFEFVQYAKMIVPALAVVLSMQSALVGSVRASTYKAKLVQREDNLSQGQTNRRQKAKSPQNDTVASDSLQKAHAAKQDKVTERREEVLSLLSEGLPEGDIADKLDVSLRTIKRDIKALNGKVVTR